MLNSTILPCRGEPCNPGVSQSQALRRQRRAVPRRASVQEAPQAAPHEDSATLAVVPRTVVAIDHTAALGGAEAALATLLGELDPEAFRVRVLLLADGPLVPRLRAAGVEVAVLEASDRLTSVGRDDAAATPLALLRNALDTVRLVPRIVRAVRGSGAELVVANSLKSAILCAIAAPLAGRRWVWHLHDRIADDYLPRPLVGALRLLARFGPRLVVANSAATLSTVPGVRGVVAHPGSIAPAPADSPANSPANSPALRRDDAEPVRFGLLGRIAPTKGQLEFVQAAGLLVADGSNARFAVLGDALFNDADYAAGVRDATERLGLGERVEFTGWVDDPFAAIAGLDVLVHASPVPEPFGQVLVEAMLSGVPVVAADAAGAAEILGGDAETGVVLAPGVRRTSFGLLARPGDPAALAAAMAWLARHPDEAAEFAEAARGRALADYTIATTARVVGAAWTDVLASRSVASRR
nr:glycosyltransferase family 4 protein [Agromyces seonyuensis]